MANQEVLDALADMRADMRAHMRAVETKIDAVETRMRESK
jgi:phage shock protein A